MEGFNDAGRGDRGAIGLFLSTTLMIAVPTIWVERLGNDKIPLPYRYPPFFHDRGICCHVVVFHFR